MATLKFATILACLVLAQTTSSMADLALELVMNQALVVPGPDIEATMVRGTIPPGDVGSDPHFHSGPTIGYVLQGEMLFQVNDEPPRILRAGESFFERDRDTHVWSGNGSNSTTCVFVATVYGRPGEAVTTFHKNYPRASYADALAAARRNPKDSKEELKK